MSQPHYERFIEAPELAKVCLTCECVKCDGICDRYRNAWRAFSGMHPLTQPKPKREKRPYHYSGSIEYNGEKHTLKEWSRITGQPYMRLYMRLWKYGMSIEEALQMPKHNLPYEVKA